MLLKRFLLLSLPLAVTACTPFVNVVDMSKVPTKERAAAMNVEVIPVGAVMPQKMAFVGPVEATSCKLLLTDPPASTANATEQLQIKALRLGGNAIIDYACDRSGTDALGTNCWNSVTCAGTAVKVAK